MTKTHSELTRKHFDFLIDEYQFEYGGFEHGWTAYLSRRMAIKVFEGRATPSLIIELRNEPEFTRVHLGDALENLGEITRDHYEETMWGHNIEDNFLYISSLFRKCEFDLLSQIETWWLGTQKIKYETTMRRYKTVNNVPVDDVYLYNLYKYIKASDPSWEPKDPINSYWKHLESQSKLGRIVMKNIHRLRFAHLPTPIEELPRLSKALGGPRILVKRDDQTGLAFGGNKTRKLEFLVAEARDQGAMTLISGGAMQSNHCRQTAAAAARYGLDCILVLNGEMPDKPSANLLLDQLFGAEIVTIADRNERNRILQETFDTAVAVGKKPYLVPYGGSSPTGALGYAFAAEELMKQMRTPSFSKTRSSELDWIVFGTSSGGTHAGLVLGQRVFGFKGKVLGISIDESEEWLKSHVSKLASDASEKLGERIEFTPADVLANADYCGAGYGVLTDAEREAVNLFAKYEGLLLDPVYTGRAAAGMIDLIRKGFFKKDETVLFWHTGGQPALFAEKYANEI